MATRIKSMRLAGSVGPRSRPERTRRRSRETPHGCGGPNSAKAAKEERGMKCRTCCAIVVCTCLAVVETLGCMHCQAIGCISCRSSRSESRRIKRKILEIVRGCHRQVCTGSRQSLCAGLVEQQVWIACKDGKSPGPRTAESHFPTR